MQPSPPPPPSPDDRGIDVVRNKIKTFATKKVTLPPGKHKVIILDEADSMTKGAQQALRRTMEVYSAHTRFALACNTSTKVIEPIQSRCAILRYAKLTDAQVLRRLHEVCAAEGIVWEAAGLEALVFTAEGDMRNALNNLQSTFAGFGEGRGCCFVAWGSGGAPHPLSCLHLTAGVVTADNVYKVRSPVSCVGPHMPSPRCPAPAAAAAGVRPAAPQEGARHRAATAATATAAAAAVLRESTPPPPRSSGARHRAGLRRGQARPCPRRRRGAVAPG